MLKKGIAVSLMILAIYWSFSALLPNKISNLDTNDNSFSTARALIHLKEITKKPHYVGSPEHEVVRNYIVKVLEGLGLETEIQEGYILTDWGTLTKPKNILARIKGTDNSKALMLLSHYDSKSHASFGASDAGSGVVTVLEGIRAYLNDNKKPKNDIIILISDAEELGLNGASLFVKNHPWTKDVGLVLNFEARGSGGPSYMLIETNGGNKNLIKGFKKANPKFPVANSLAYSIYKELPNDTDLTRFREEADIDGFNFAFIDDHFDYHTALDTYERLDRNTLEHQGSYLMPLLNYFADTNLNNVKSDADDIYFNVPLFKIISYPFSWIIPMFIIAVLLFIAIIIYGIKKKTLNTSEIGKGFLPLLGTLIINGVIGYFSWKLLREVYPQYNEMLHGFTYNGHTYIWVFVLLSLAVSLWVYHKFYKPENTASLLVAPIFIWLILCAYVAMGLKGASFFIVPELFALLSLFVLVRQKKPSLILMTLLLFPLLMIMSPLVKMLPVGLGLQMLIATTLVVSLIFILSISVFGFFKHKNRWSYAFFALAFCCFISAHFNSKFNEEHPKPNSMIYVLNADDNSAIWKTYDHILDDWTKTFLSDNPNEIVRSNAQASKYSTRFTFEKPTDVREIPLPIVEKQQDTIIDNLRYVKLKISPQRLVNTISISTDTTAQFMSFNVNGLDIEKDKNGMVFSGRNRLFDFIVADDNVLELSFTTPPNQKTEFVILETSYDLLSNPLFDIPERSESMIPKPFVLNDAVAVRKTITIE